MFDLVSPFNYPSQMFLHLSASHSVHGTGGLASQHALGRGGLHPGGWRVFIQGVLHPGGGVLHPGDEGVWIQGEGSAPRGRGVCIWWWGICIQGGLHPGERGSAFGGVGQTPLWDTWDTMGYGQWVGGTHPTGMHSCSSIIILIKKNCCF